ncbi:MAG: 3-hydroxyacyl-CoA dehydrogenase NAD-binding domain-containing protein, partial [Myxococcota bacterium]
MNRILVLGAGTMGAGIAEVAAKAGGEAVLSDVSEEQLERARATNA